MTNNDARQLYERATNTEQNQLVLHVRALGRSRDIAFDAIAVTSASSDEAIRQAVAQFMDVSVEQLRGTIIERHENGNLTLRPEAVFG